MKFFWNVACELYTGLVTAGIKIPPSHRFFNQPKTVNDIQLVEEIHGDISFPEYEKHYILRAAKDFQYFSNDQIVFDIKFDLNPTDKQALEDQAIILRVDKTHPFIVEMDGYYKHNTLGLCQFREDNNAIYMVHDRLSNPITYRTTAIHELGHFVGMDHTKGRSIMYKHNNNGVLYPTYIDAVEFAEIYDCKPEDLRYFKL